MGETLHLQILANAVGHLAGLAVFGIFFWLILSRANQPSRVSVSSSALAAALALLWNLGSLAVLLIEPAHALRDLLVALSFSVLSILPAVLLHIALSPQHRWIRRCGYLVSSVAASGHVSEALGTHIFSHDAGIRLVTAGFGSLAVISAVVLSRGRAQRREAGKRTLAAMALFLFAASFVHFGAEHGPGSWAHELIIHHAGIPLALIVLLQDFRFLLLDVFVRVIGAVALASTLAVGLSAVGAQLGIVDLDAEGVVPLGSFIALICATILAFPLISAKLTRFAEKRIFHRVNVGEGVAAIQSMSAAGGEELIVDGAQRIAQFAGATRHQLLDVANGSETRGVYTQRESHPGLVSNRWAEMAVVFKTASGPTRTLLLGPREGGRRYLSADVADLEVLAGTLEIRLEAVRHQEQKRLLTEAELQALRAQINPHFLFNALNTLYGIIPRNAVVARDTLLNLADIFRYTLESKEQMVPLGDEIRVIEAYLEVERIRLGGRLRTEYDIDDDVRDVLVPALSIQPLVENAVKHGIGAGVDGGCVRVTAVRNGAVVAVDVTDDGATLEAGGPATSGHGLANVRRRLQLCYGENVELNVEAGSEATRVGFQIPVTPSANLIHS